MKLPGLAALAGLLNAREDLPELPGELPSGPERPPHSLEQIQALAASKRQVEQRLERASSRLEQAQVRLQRLSALPPPLLQALEPAAERRQALLAACVAERKVAAEYVQTLEQHLARVGEALARAREEHRSTRAYRQAHLQERSRGPRLAPQGPEAPLGAEVAQAVSQAVDELHDLLLSLELSQSERPAAFYWDLKDRLDDVRDGVPDIAQAPLPEGWSTLCRSLSELRAVQAALSSGPEARS